MVLVPFQAQGRKLGQDLFGQAGTDQQLQTDVGCGDRTSLTSSSRIRSADTISIRPAIADIESTMPGSTGKPS